MADFRGIVSLLLTRTPTSFHHTTLLPFITTLLSPSSQPCFPSSQPYSPLHHNPASLHYTTLLSPSSLYPTNKPPRFSQTNQLTIFLPSFLPSFHSNRFLQNRLLVPPFAFKQPTQHRSHRLLLSHRLISMLQTVSQQLRQRGFELLLQLLPDQLNHRFLSLRQRSTRSTRFHCPALERIARGS